MRDSHALQKPSHVAEVFVHHSASFGASIDTHAEQVATMQQLQNFHMDGRGWADIAYHFVVFQPRGKLKRAVIFAGRPLNVVPAAQEGHNTNTVAICIVQADPERLATNTVWRVGRLARRIRSARRLRGHYEVVKTECPGALIRATLPRIAKIAGKTR
jgi:hypothetical protein